MITINSWFHRLKQLLNTFTAAKPKQFDERPDIVRVVEPTAPIYKQTSIDDPAKHIRELSETRRPYANVPHDMID
jgi:hypothetical protein